MWTVAARAIAGALGAALLTTIASASASSGNGKIVFESGVGATPADYQLYEANQDGTGLTTLARGLDASWSPDGMRIAYVGPGEQGGRDVYVMNANGSGQTRLTTGLAPSFYLLLPPVWSPDGRTLAVVRSNPPELYLIPAAGGAPRPLASDVGFSRPTWSRDGSQLAYEWDLPGGGVKLAVADVDGAAVHPVTLPATLRGPTTPAWSPVDDRIAFAADGLFYVVNPDGSGLRKLTNVHGDGPPVWSPDATKLAFSSWENGLPGYRGMPFRIGRDIYVVNTDGTGTTELTESARRAVTDGSPVWSPDGRRIAFASTRGRAPLTDVFEMNADGSCETVLSLLGPAAHPAWQPLASQPPSDPLRCVDLRIDLAVDADPDRLYSDAERIYLYTAVVTNDGTLPGTGVRVAEVLPDGGAFVSAEPSQGACSGSKTVTCELGSITPGSRATVIVRFRVPQPAALMNAVTVSSGEPDSDPSSNSERLERAFPFCRVVTAPAATIEGTSGYDSVCGTIHSDRIDTRAGDDHVYAGPGDDRINGGGGNDWIDGGAGNDRVLGGAGNDRVHGAAGRDRLDAGPGDDWIYADDGGDRIWGRSGVDTIYGSAGRDAIDTGAGNDLVYAGTGADIVGGGRGNDTIYGNAGNDVLVGGSGRDELQAGAGDDTIYARDGQRDYVECGPGHDRALVDPFDTVKESCETVAFRR